MKGAIIRIGRAIRRRLSGEHPYPDSAKTATAPTMVRSRTTAPINVDPEGHQVSTVAHELQAQGWAIGVVT